MITLYYRRSSLHLPQEAKSLMALGTTDGCFCVMIYSSVHFFNYLRPSEKTFLRTWILNLEFDFLIKALVLCSLLEEELAEALCAPVPSSSFPGSTRIYFRFFRWKWKACSMSRRPWKNQRHCTCRWFGHWSPPPRCQRTEHSWNLFVIFSVSKLLIIMFTNNDLKTSTYHLY